MLSRVFIATSTGNLLVLDLFENQKFKGFLSGGNVKEIFTSKKSGKILTFTEPEDNSKLTNGEITITTGFAAKEALNLESSISVNHRSNLEYERLAEPRWQVYRDIFPGENSLFRLLPGAPNVNFWKISVRKTI